jgi:UDP-N-acetylmuramate dehydrogenase
MLLLPFDKANYRTPKNWETVVAFLKSNLLKTDFEKIHQQFPEMKYDVSETEVKVPAGWLIEQAGFKKRFGDAGIHKIKHWF